MHLGYHLQNLKVICLTRSLDAEVFLKIEKLYREKWKKNKVTHLRILPLHSALGKKMAIF